MYVWWLIYSSRGYALETKTLEVVYFRILLKIQKKKKKVLNNFCSHLFVNCLKKTGVTQPNFSHGQIYCKKQDDRVLFNTFSIHKRRKEKKERRENTSHLVNHLFPGPQRGANTSPLPMPEPDPHVQRILQEGI